MLFHTYTLLDEPVEPDVGEATEARVILGLPAGKVYCQPPESVQQSFLVFIACAWCNHCQLHDPCHNLTQNYSSPIKIVVVIIIIRRDIVFRITCKNKTFCL